MKKPPIFIVGVPRSGTTLLAAMLSSHSRMICGPETHFFSRLSKIEVNPVVNHTTWPEHAVNFLRSIDHNNFSQANRRISLLEKYNLSEAQIYAYLEKSSPSVLSMLSSITEQYLAAAKKHRWVEKTPDHIEYVDRIRNFFPDSPIIRIVRDPRDNCLSLTKVPWGAKSLPEALVFWKRLMEASNSFFTDDKLSYTIRFEDLLTSPADELKKLCNFIDEDFEEAMLSTEEAGKSLNSRNVPWKEKVSKPLDTARIFAWKKELREEEKKLADAFVGDFLRQFGYQMVSVPVMLGEVTPHSQIRHLSPEQVNFIVSKSIRIWKNSLDERPTVRIYIGEPGLDWPQRSSSKGAIVEYTSLFVEILKAILDKTMIFWLSENDGANKSGKGIKALFIKQILKPFRTQLPVNPVNSR
jgi:hypothetical protein